MKMMEKMKKGAKDIGESAEDVLGKVAEEGAEFGKKTKDVVGKGLGKTKEVVEEGTEKVKGAVKK
jgi:gas vesicle protein